MKWMSKMSDALLILGCGGMIYGVSLFSIGAAWILGGIMLILSGVFLGLSPDTWKNTLQGKGRSNQAYPAQPED